MENENGRDERGGKAEKEEKDKKEKEPKVTSQGGTSDPAAPPPED